MHKKVITKGRKEKTSKTSKLISSKAVTPKIGAANSLTRQSASRKSSSISVNGKFVSAKTGRVIKTSPAKPRLGSERIETVVRKYVRGDARTKRFAA